MGDLRLRQKATERCGEIADVAQGLKSDHVVVHQTGKKFGPPGQRLKNIRSRKRDVMEICNPAVKSAMSQAFAHQHEMVVLNPDGITASPNAFKSLRELIVRFAIGTPVRGIVAATGRKSVKQRPDYLVGKSVIKAVFLLGRHEHRMQRIVMRCALVIQNRGQARFVIRPCGSNPATALCADNRNKSGDKSTSARLKAQITVG